MIERLLAWYIFWSIGACYFYSFVMHGFFGRMSAAFIGWTDSPFQFKVAAASPGFAAVARHIHQMVTQHNFAPGNAGVVLYTDVGIPVFGAGLLWMWRRSGGGRVLRGENRMKKLSAGSLKPCLTEQQGLSRA